jgi:hypothetical protein
MGKPGKPPPRKKLKADQQQDTPTSNAKKAEVWYSAVNTQLSSAYGTQCCVMCGYNLYPTIEGLSTWCRRCQHRSLTVFKHQTQPLAANLLAGAALQQQMHQLKTLTKRSGSAVLVAGSRGLAPLQHVQMQYLHQPPRQQPYSPTRNAQQIATRSWRLWLRSATGAAAPDKYSRRTAL